MILIKFKPSQHKLHTDIIFNRIYSGGFLFRLEKQYKIIVNLYSMLLSHPTFVLKRFVLRDRHVSIDRTRVYSIHKCNANIQRVRYALHLFNGLHYKPLLPCDLNIKNNIYWYLIRLIVKL